jgi:hypothetical protein
MEKLLETIIEYIRDFLMGVCIDNLNSMFDYVNERAGQIAISAGQTPGSFNSSILDLIRNLSNNVMVPIAGLILTYVLVYELISMVVNKNHGNEFSTGDFFKYFFKMVIAVELVSHTLDITLAFFDVGQYIVNQASSVISGSTAIDASSTMNMLVNGMQDMELSELFLLALETLIVNFFTKILSVIITTIMFGRMIEIYLYVSVSPVPFATLTNREWGTIGTNYIRGVLALAFQGFFMTLCVGIYSVLIRNMTISSDMHMSLFSILAYTLVLAISLYHTGSLSKSLFNAH